MGWVLKPETDCNIRCGRSFNIRWTLLRLADVLVTWYFGIFCFICCFVLCPLFYPAVSGSKPRQKEREKQMKDWTKKWKRGQRIKLKKNEAMVLFGWTVRVTLSSAVVFVQFWISACILFFLLCLFSRWPLITNILFMVHNKTISFCCIGFYILWDLVR